MTTAPHRARPARRRPPPGLLLLAASMVGHAGNYLFYIVAARMLGVSQFAEVSAIIAYSLIVFQPMNGIQVAAAGDVARLRSRPDPAAVSGLVRGLTRWSLVTGLGLAVLLLSASFPLTYWLDLSTWALAGTAALWIPLGMWLVVGTGVIQGMQRFGLVGLMLAGPQGALRTALLPLGILLTGLTGAIWAMTAATVIGLLMLYRPIRASTAVSPVPTRFRPGPSVVTLLSFASLTNLDVIIAKAALDPVSAGNYSAAALMGKIALYAPAALTLVLLPRAAAALERGEPAERLVLLTMGVTAATGLTITGAFAVVPTVLLTATFGPEFAAAAGLIVPLALVMTLASLLYVHLTFAVARRSRGFLVLIVATALAHMVLLALLHDAPQQLILATATAVAGATLAHEIGSPFGVVRMLLRTRRKSARSHAA